MGTVEDTILDQNVILNGYIDDFRAEAETHIEELKATGELAAALGSPPVSFFTTSTFKLADDPNVTADFNSGLAYPDADDIIITAQQSGYDSDFLEFMEQSLRVDQSAVWTATIEAIRQAYQAATTVAAQAFVNALLPSYGNRGNTFAAEMDAQVTDAGARHEIDYGRFQDALTVNMRNAFTAQARKSGTGIEDIRAKVVQDMLAVHTDYNRAVLAKAETDFRALVARTQQIHQQYAMRVQEYQAEARQTYEVAELEQRKTLLQLDTFMAEQTDQMRRSHMDFALQLSRAASLTYYASQGMGAAMLAKGVDTAGTLEGGG